MATIPNPSCIRSCVDLDAVIRQVSSLLPSCCSPHASSSVHAIGTLRTNSCQCLLAFGSSSARDKSVAQARSLFGSLVLLVFPRTRNLVRIWTSSWRTYRHLTVWYRIPEVRHPRPWSAAGLCCCCLSSPSSSWPTVPVLLHLLGTQECSPDQPRPWTQAPWLARSS